MAAFQEMEKRRRSFCVCFSGLFFASLGPIRHSLAKSARGRKERLSHSNSSPSVRALCCTEGFFSLTCGGLISASEIARRNSFFVFPSMRKAALYIRLGLMEANWGERLGNGEKEEKDGGDAIYWGVIDIDGRIKEGRGPFLHFAALRWSKEEICALCLLLRCKV